MAIISSTLASLDIRHRLTWSLVWWAAVRSGMSRLIPALFSVFYRIPALLYKSEADAEKNAKDQEDVSEDENGGKIECEVLYSPPENLWDLDIIFIHGLHGSTVKTWRQGDWNKKYPAVQKKLFRRHSAMNLTKAKRRKRKTFRSMSTPNNFGNPILKEESEDEGENENEECKLDEDILYFETKKERDNFLHRCENLINENPSQNVVELCDKRTENCDTSRICETVELEVKYNSRMKRKLENDNQSTKLRKTDDSLFDGEEDIWTFLESSMDKPECEDDGFPSKSSSTETSDADADDDDEDPFDKHRHIFYPEETPASLISDCWPRDWIPQDYPGARVICISYTTDRYLWRPVWMKPQYRSSLEERTREMVKKLADIKSGTKPILWVGHSKGGLFIKEIFSKGFEDFKNDELESEHSKIYEMTKAMIFYSVPHRGSQLANINIPPLIRTSSELHEIQYESGFVLKLHEKFMKAITESKNPPNIQSYMETRRTLMGAFYLRIVSLFSGDPGIGNMYGVSLDHREICKPTSRSCFLYQELLEVIQDIFKEN